MSGEWISRLNSSTAQPLIIMVPCLGRYLFRLGIQSYSAILSMYTHSNLLIQKGLLSALSIKLANSDGSRPKNPVWKLILHSEPEQKSLSLRFSSSTKNLSLSPKKRPGLDLDPSQQAKTLNLELSNHPHSFLIDKILRKGVMTRIVLDNKKAELA